MSGRIARKAVALSGVLAFAVTALAGPAAAGDDPSGSEGAQTLADRYAPIIRLKAQAHECDADGEPYAPTSVDVVLDNPDVLLRQVGTDDPVIMRAPTAADIFDGGEGVYLDWPGAALEPGCLYEQDFDRYSADRRPVVYAHIATQEGRPGQLALQYWFFWYYNDWVNKHEGDWEGIQLLFDASSVEEALAATPVSVGYAQHEGGERADWDSSKLDRVGDRPVVYSSAGSHASYFGAALYLGRGASEGFGCDNTDGPSDELDPEAVLLPDQADDPDSENSWLAFDGRWGERHGGPFNGPTGPATKERWTDPIDWHDALRGGSVIVPAGDSQGLSVISAFCGTVEWGSAQLIALTTSPLRVLIALAIAVTVGRWLAGRTDWSSVEPRPLVRRRRAGQIIRAAARTYRHHPRAYLIFGLVYVPVAILGGLFGALAQLVPVLGDVIDAAGSRSGTGVVLALFLGGLAHLVAYVAVNATVATYRHELDQGAEPDPWRVVGDVWRSAGALLAGVARAAVTVGILFVSVVGIPWGIRQLVRYQFLGPTVMIEGRDGREALARSSDLVRGRWWQTATTLTAVNLLAGLVGLVVSLGLLVVFASIPIWLFSSLVTLVYALTTPMAAAAVTLLYGDAVAQAEGADTADLVADTAAV